VSEDPWGKVIELSTRQLGLVSIAQVKAAGLSPRVALPRLRDGEWLRVHRGWYRVANGPMTDDQRLLATQLIAGPDAALSHMTAARLHRLDVPRTTLVDVTVPHGRHGASYADARVYRSRELQGSDVDTSRRPFRVTSVARTPQVQYKFGPKHTVDFSFAEHRLLIEVDSWTHHASFSAYRTDRQRDVAAFRQGWNCFRYTWLDIVEDRPRVIAQLRDILARTSPQHSLRF
jgi:Protein of unknown function (DUF559)